MNREESILVIFNPSSGAINKDTAVSAIFKVLRENFHTVSIINSKSPDHTRDIIEKTKTDYSIITAFGGDGTINSVARQLINTPLTLGILPGGSGNGLVRNLGIPLSWRKALEVLINGQDIVLDCGTINDILFFNVAGIGLDGLISKKFNLESKNRGLASYFYHSFKGYLEMSTYRVTFRNSGLAFDEDIVLTAFANFKQYGGKAIIAPFAQPDDGHLDLCILNQFKLIKQTLNIQRLFTGNIHKLPFYKSHRITDITVQSHSGPIPFHFDGEYGGYDSETFDVRILPQSIRIRVPRPETTAVTPA
jgi:YegS/Rv2252/BmrU family lipid kinase